MRDPHVERLYYTVGSGSPTISYEDPTPLIFHNELGKFELRDEKAVVEPSEHFATEEAARDAVEPFLRAWEVATDLTQNPGTIRFTFERGDVVDLNPPGPGETVELTLKPAQVRVYAGQVTFHLTSHRYPEAPTGFQATSDVQLAHRRWLAHREGKEPLQSMAYFVLTLLEARAETRQKLAEMLNVEFKVLSTMGYLCSEKGDAESARKAGAVLGARDLSGPERAWLQAVTKRLILRLGEHAAGTPLSRIEMREFPTIDR